MADTLVKGRKLLDPLSKKLFDKAGDLGLDPIQSSAQAIEQDEASIKQEKESFRAEKIRRIKEARVPAATRDQSLLTRRA